MNVGAMKDYKLELRNLHASHALDKFTFKEGRGGVPGEKGGIDEVE